MKGLVVAVTGSVGKTSTKEMLALAFAAQGDTHASIASYNNHWGVPLSLARMPRSACYGVFEVGMNHPFEILPLSALIRPHIAVITAIEPVHLAQFRMMAGIADAKGEVFSGIEPGGVALIPGDGPYADRLALHAAAGQAGRLLRFGARPGNDVRLLDARLLPDCTIVSAEVLGTEVAFRINAPGRHHAMNALAVLGAVRAAGQDLALAALSLARFSLVTGRGSRFELRLGEQDSFTLIDESYNANPSSMRAAVAVLGGQPRGARGRRIAVLADMLELGLEGPAMHQALAEVLEQHTIDQVFATGALMRHLWQALPVDLRGAFAASVDALIPLLIARIGPGDAVMVKGSNSTGIRRVVEALRHRFPQMEASPTEDLARLPDPP
jgi:UDP-N-acetylmuramoyl-tripeptide--D-alanyl-D-alanine ligase